MEATKVSDKNITPFGEYGICIRDMRPSNICPIDVSKIKVAEYLFQRGCSFDIYKWNGEFYSGTLRFDGKEYHKLSGEDTKSKTPHVPLTPMHIWFNGLEDLQKWLGQYYESAITCMLSPGPTKNISEEDETGNVFKNKFPYNKYDWDIKNTKYWNYKNLNDKLDNMINKVSTWKVIK